MGTLAKMSWVELKLFLREPLTVLFALALPLIVLFILGGVFGNEAEEDVFRGVGPMNYYVPAYVGLVIASISVISVPTHLAGNRERGVLKRFHASSVPVWAVLGSQVVVSFVVATVSSLLLLLAAFLAYDIADPVSVPGMVWAFAYSAVAFAIFGVLLGALLPTARAAQAFGLLLWFVMLFLAGAGPPPEVLTDAMRRISDATPLRYVITLLQDQWLGFATNSTDVLVIGGVLVVSALLTLRFFRWE